MFGEFIPLFCDRPLVRIDQSEVRGHGNQLGRRDIQVSNH